jgi:hypothetical protein
MRRGEAIAVRLTPIGEQAIRFRSERDAGMEEGTKLLNQFEPKAHQTPQLHTWRYIEILAQSSCPWRIRTTKIFSSSSTR